MARANAAYYATRDPFADFATAPEIAQVFGELLGAWAVVTWRTMGAPDGVILAEAGPGNGTLMADALRLVRRLAPELHRTARLHLVESSRRLRDVQARALAPDRPDWHDAVSALPSGPIILFANEFLDALPIRQFERRGGAWG
ncbi:MAG: SAM-dependent methyltransferase, partial [Gluconacetobacter diazotrophicus]|nr:SAM-dependent methyltransferase [Gluconacetobacter diazotrophicus]